MMLENSVSGGGMSNQLMLEISMVSESICVTLRPQIVVQSGAPVFIAFIACILGWKTEKHGSNDCKVASQWKRHYIPTQ